jgi:hypothetical protein
MIDFKGLKQYLLNRANEVSTWRGVVLLLAATGSVLTPDQQELIVTLGIGVAGLIGALFPEQIVKKDQGDVRTIDG